MPTEHINLDGDDAPVPETFETARPVARNWREREATREEPKALEAEQYLLGCCFIDGSDVVAKCVDAHLRPQSFFDRAHGEVFSSMLDLFRAKQPIDVSSVVVEMQARKTLAGIGGVDFITDLSSKVPTTAFATQFIDKVRGAAVARELIRESLRTLEECYGFTDGTEALLSRVQSRVSAIARPVTATRKGTPLTQFTVPPDSDSSVLLGRRFLNRGDGAVLVSTSGMGKSSMVAQMAALWALGRDAFGIPCNGPLRSLIVQAEDSDGDVGEVWASIAHMLKLTPAEVAQVTRNVRVVCERVLRGDAFLNSLRRQVEEFKPDLVIPNPLQAFMDGDVTDSQDLGRFLRGGLNSLNEPPTFAYIVVHHTTKPATGKDRAERLWHEVMYDMAGGAEIINWARAIMSLRAGKNEGEFNLVLAKRGRRAGVMRKVEQGAGFILEPMTTIPLKHSSERMELPDGRTMPVIFWEGRDGDAPATPAEGASTGGRPAAYEFNHYRDLFPRPDEDGLPIAQLEKRLIPNGRIPRKSLESALARWERDTHVEKVRVDGQPTRWRRVL
jgi:hypothetical protein